MTTWTVFPSIRRQTRTSSRCRPRACRAVSTAWRSWRTSARKRRTTATTSSRELGFAYDLNGTGRNIIRGGWGVYQDFGYTNSNILFPALDTAGGHGQVFFVNNPTGILKADGTLYTPLDPVSSIAFRNEVDTSRPPLLGQVSSPSPRAAVHAPDEPRLGASAELVDRTDR